MLITITDTYTGVTSSMLNLKSSADLSMQTVLETVRACYKNSASDYNLADIIPVHFHVNRHTNSGVFIIDTPHCVLHGTIVPYYSLTYCENRAEFILR